MGPVGPRTEQQQFGIGGRGETPRLRRGPCRGDPCHGSRFGTSQQQQHLGLARTDGPLMPPVPGLLQGATDQGRQGRDAVSDVHGQLRARRG